MTTFEVLDQYPSTADLPPLTEPVEDPVLEILKGARRRYARRACSEAYLYSNGAVCAIGAVAREAGLTRAVYNEDDSRADLGVDFAGNLLAAQLEDAVIAAAREAIALLNESAARLFPESADFPESAEGKRATEWIRWSGPLEWINQEIRPFRTAKKAVLECYDVAIARRAEAVA